MKALPRILAFTLALAATSNTLATDAWTVLGIASDLVALTEIGSRIMGRTTVIPAFRLYDWSGAYFGTYSGNPFGTQRQIRYSAWTDVYFYNTIWRDHTLGWVNVSSAPFSLTEVCRVNKTCDRNGDGKFVFKTVEDFTLMVWASSVIKSGIFPPIAPYPTFIKGISSVLGTGCEPDPDITKETRSNQIDLRDLGTVLVKMLPQRSYPWGMILWSGHFYDH